MSNAETSTGKRKVGAVIQARMGSSRFPGKVLADLQGRPLLGQILDRLRRCTTLDTIIIATSTEPEDRPLCRFAGEEGVPSFAGSLQDVQKRFLDVADAFDLDVIVRICGDSPFVDPVMIDRLVTELIAASGDYAEPSPEHPAAYEGMEAITMEALRRARAMGDEGPDREHVTLFARRHPEHFRLVHPIPDEDVRGRFRLSVDNLADLEFARAVYAALHKPGESFTTLDLVRFLAEHPEVSALNAHVRQKSTDAHDFHVAFLIGHDGEEEATLARARELNERFHCGIAYLGEINEETAARLRAMGFRADAVARRDWPSAMAARLRVVGAKAVLMDDAEFAETLRSLGFDTRPLDASASDLGLDGADATP